MKTIALFTFVFLLFSVVSIYSQEKTVLWSEDFEKDWSENWYVNIGTWEVGTPTSGPQGAFKGNNCAATVLNGDYIEPVDTRLIRFTSFVVPPSSENPQIQFWHWWSFSTNDWGEVQIKTKNGDWETVSIRFDRYGSDAWYLGSIELSDYADSVVQLAFYFHSKPTSIYGNTSAGWYIDEVKLITGPGVLNNPEGFESGLGDWLVEKGTWDIGIPTVGPSGAHGGQNCFGTKLDDNYHEGVDSRLISPPFVVPSASENPRFQFWHWFSFGRDDWGKVQIKTDKGEWRSVSIDFNNYGGDSWYPGSIDLSGYADSTVQIAFYFHSEYYGIYTYVSSGWYIDDVSLVTGPFVFNNPEDFESGLNDWIVDKGTWEVGLPTFGPSNAYGGENCAGTNLDGNYHETVDSRLISRPFVVPVESVNPAIRFWHWFSFGRDDWGKVQITTDKGLTWETISTQAINASSGSWTPYYIPLSSYAESTVQLAFYFHSELYGIYTYVSSGWYIDDIRIHDNSDLAVYAGPDVSLDSCGSTTINATVSGGTEPYVIEWIPERGLDDPASLTPFASPSDTTVYTIKVTDAHGCFRTDRVVINTHCEAENTEAEILSFSFGKPPQSGSTNFDPANHSVALAVKYGTDLTHLISTFTLSEGATAAVEGVDQISGFTANDFTNPVIYRITAEDGITYQDWAVTVQIALVDIPEFISYSFGEPPQRGQAIINLTNHSVDLKVEYGTDVTGLVASYTISEGATATIGGVIQESGLTGNDFTEPLTYTLTAVDGETVQDWIVTVDVATAVGIEENSSQHLKIYPNPFSEAAIIDVSNPDQSNLTIYVFGALGNKVFEKEISNSETIELRKGSFPAGVYMVVMKGGMVLENKMVVIQ